MRKLKLTLKKEIISDLESKEIKGGINTTSMYCATDGDGCKPITYADCKTQGNSCWSDCAVPSCNGCEPSVYNCGTLNC